MAGEAAEGQPLRGLSPESLGGEGAGGVGGVAGEPGLEVVELAGGGEAVCIEFHVQID